MKKELNNHNLFKPVIESGRIKNIENIIAAIDQEYDEGFLKEYAEEVFEFNKQYQRLIKDNSLNKLINVLNERIELLTLPIGFETFNRLLNAKYNDEVLTKQDLTNMELYASMLLNKMDRADIHYDEQNSLDLYIIALANQDLRDKYDNAIKKSQEQRLNNNKIEDQQLVLKPIDSKGAILTVTIIEVTLLLGILLGVLIIVQR